MASCALLWMTSSLKWVNAMVGEDVFIRGNKSEIVYLRSKIGGSLGSFRFVRSIMFIQGECRFLFYSTRERWQAASVYIPDKNLRGGSQLKEAVTELVNRVDQGISVNSYAYNTILKWCSEEKDLELVKQVHDSIKDNQMEQHPYVGKMLLRCYIECERLDIAQETFSKLMRKDTVAWNMMISGCVKQDLLDDAFVTYKQMRNEGGLPDAITYLSALKACTNPRALKWGREIHGHIIRDKFQDDLRIGNALVRMYLTCGSVGDARAVFFRLGRRDVCSWNLMIDGLAKHGLGHEAFCLFLQMQREGFTPDAITYLSILSPCTSTIATGCVKEVHAHATEAGFDVDVQVGTALVQVYCKSGSIEDARAVFGRLGRRDVFSWNVMIGGLAANGLGLEAFSLFLKMQREGFTPDAITYISILNPCSSTGAINWVKKVHAHAMRDGRDLDVRVGNAIVHMYAKSGSIDDARAVFGRLGRRDMVSWTVMIGGLAEHGHGHEAFSLFLQMQREGFRPDTITYLSILNPCSCRGAEEWLKEVHAHALEAGLDVDMQVGTALVQMYAKSGSIDDARAVFGRLRKRNVWSWNVIIGALAEHGLGHEAFSSFLQMQREGCIPDAITYLSILNPRSSTSAVEWVKEVQAHAREAGLDVHEQVGNALVQMFSKTGLIADAIQVFDKMQNRSVISWDAMICGLSQHGHGRKALQLFEEMKAKGVKPDGVLFVAVLSACSHAGLVEEGRLLFASMRQDYGIEPALEHYTCMVDMLGRAGLLEEAKLFILNMAIKPDVVTWTAFLGACRTHKNTELAELAVTECLKLNLSGAAPYVLLSNVYAAVGKLDQVTLIRRFMEERGINKDPGRCWIEIDDKVHHFLAGDTSHPETREIYSTLSHLSKELQAEGYVADTRLVLRNISEEDKESALCYHSEKLAIAYGLMHTTPGNPYGCTRTSGYALIVMWSQSLYPRSRVERLWPGMQIVFTTSKMVYVLVATTGDEARVFQPG